jgi:N-acyl-D-aspartate/D-glutamate deacylase
VVADRATQATDYDVLIRRAVIVDGTGGPRRTGELGIRDGRIVAEGPKLNGSAREVIDARGQVVAPGFIDVHSHADGAYADARAAAMPGFLKQGVTTAVFGVDGDMGPGELRDYIDRAANGGSGINFMAYVGHNTVRRSVMQRDSRAPTAAEMQAMRSLVREGMELGAIGLSTGLMYLPGRFSGREEIIELVRVTKPYAGLYDSHVRDEPGDVLASLQECLDIAYAAGVPAHPAHLKAVSAVNFGKGPDLVRMVEAAQERGHEVTADAYPYDGASSRSLIALLLPGDDDQGRVLRTRLDAVARRDARIDDPGLEAALVDYWKDTVEGSERYRQAVANTERPDAGTFSWVQTVGYRSMRIVSSSQAAYEGRMVTDLAAEQRVSPFELYRRMAVAEGARAIVTLGAILEEDVRVILRQPWVMVSSDGQELNPRHPRGRGAFARVLGRYVREWKLLSLETAVHKMTGLPATYLRLTDRGVIRAGAVADLVIFDPDAIVDRSTWSEPTLHATGVHHVMIAGEFAVRDGELTHQRYGRFIPYRGKR